MQKVPGVASVSVSLDEGLTVLELTPANTVTLAQLRQVIRNNGFTTREGKITARGSLTRSNNAAVFQVAGSEERLAIISSGNGAMSLEALRARFKNASRIDAVIDGTVDLTDAKQFKLSIVELKSP